MKRKSTLLKRNAIGRYSEYHRQQKEKKNTEILKELKVGQLKRHDPLEKHILEARLEGKRRKGRLRRRWADNKEWLQMSPTEAGREAQRREVFRRMVLEATSTQTCQDE